MDFLDLLMREPLKQFYATGTERPEQWRGGPLPPASMLKYIEEVRKHLLLRIPAASQCARNRAVKPVQKLAWHVAVGMTVKKVHEVGLFSSYVDKLMSTMASAYNHNISHLVDFGSGQNYLGRALASPPYSKHIVAIETKGHNQDKAKQFDTIAKLTPRQRYMYNKKATIAGRELDGVTRTPPEQDQSVAVEKERIGVKVDPAADGVGSVQYVEHFIKDGDLSDVVEQVAASESSIDDPIVGTMENNPNIMVMSLHSCGNLVHHGLRSLVMNKAVTAVAMVGCCYNLVTERLSPATYKLPELRPSAHPRVELESTACDPHGFPMSERLCNLHGQGIRLNITARMMAVQAPQNWGEKDSNGFFTRHFYRALLQRIFLDKGVVGPPSVDNIGGSPLGHSSGTPIIIGSLRKACYADFVSYVRGALAKLTVNPERGALFKEKLSDLTDDDIEYYAQQYAHRKKELSAIWSLMAFSAGVVEAVIVADRYSWLKEQREVAHAWAEPVFDYALSPRNLVIVGVKRQGEAETL
ncbi:hypothetical protein AMS68_007482 [Peltaster fructicola]|uniref:Methyltransferase domain-containing protein n=1 Tax=Peltaster fructicola TaxID=286661 RepID=A0A6H0Y4X8_9PEZI|nr:hypothetical protein AMS68_007482 [Peltaster fructicola]